MCAYFSDAYYSAQTRRAVENFPISGLTAPPELVVATIQIKKAAADTNAALGRLSPDIANAIMRAADEILDGRLRDQFVVDVPGRRRHVAQQRTPTRSWPIGRPNCSVKRAEAFAGHPNDHVNMGQSPMTAFPPRRGLRFSGWLHRCRQAAANLSEGLKDKSREFTDV